MELLWPALGICVIVFFVFFILAQHWQRVLRHQNGTIRQLASRVKNLEEISDPQFRRRLEESAPVPLEQVFTLSFRLSDRFWHDTLHMSEENWQFIRTYGSFVGSVKLEKWRSHTVATITEVLPESKTARWQTRSLDFYPDATSDAAALTLWELPLARTIGSAERPPLLELALSRDAVELRGHLVPSTKALGESGKESRNETDTGEAIFFRVPLDTGLLAEFRSRYPLDSAAGANDNSEANAIPTNGGSWQAFYSNQDENLGIEWQLWLRDLTRKAEWERWKVLETAAVQFGASSAGGAGPETPRESTGNTDWAYSTPTFVREEK